MQKLPRPNTVVLDTVVQLWAEYRKVADLPDMADRITKATVAEGLRQATDALLSSFLKAQGVTTPSTDLDCHVEDYQIMVFDDNGEETFFYWHENSVSSDAAENFNPLNFKRLEKMKKFDWFGTTVTVKEQAENDRSALIHAACEEVLGRKYPHNLNFERITPVVFRIYDTSNGETVLAIHE